MPGNFTGRYGWAQAASPRLETLPVKIESQDSLSRKRPQGLRHWSRLLMPSPMKSGFISFAIGLSLARPKPHPP